MIEYADQECAKLATLTPSASLGNTYYDQTWVMFQIADYTSNPAYLTCAANAIASYRDTYVIPNGGAAGYWNFSKGLREDWERNGAALSKEAVRILSGQAAYCLSPLSWLDSPVRQREAAYCSMAHMNALAIGAHDSDPSKKAAVEQRIIDFTNTMLSHLDQLFESRTYRTTDPFTTRPECAAKYHYIPFWTGLTARALIQRWDETGDPRIVPALQNALDTVWAEAWRPSLKSFWYENCKDDPEDEEWILPDNDSCDISNLILPAYQWMYLRTGDSGYQDKADLLFQGAVGEASSGNCALDGGAYLDRSKPFNQNYLWSFDYVRWRSGALPLAITTTTLPGGTTGTAYSQDLAVTGGTLPVTSCTVTVGALPDGLSIAVNGAADGCTISGTPSAANTFNFTVTVEDNAEDTDTQALTIVVGSPVGSPSITTTTAPNGIVGQQYGYVVVCEGGVTPYTFTVQSGALCGGTSLGAATGEITGTPDTGETCSYTIRCTDDDDAFDDQAFTVTMSVAVVESAAAYPASTSAEFHIGSVGVTFQDDCEAHVFLGSEFVAMGRLTIGPAKRHIGVYGLDGSTNYLGNLFCRYQSTDDLVLHSEIPFTTYPESTGTQNVKYSVGAPPAAMTTAENLLIDCAPNTTSGTPVVDEIVADCTEGCTATMPLTAGLWFCRHYWRDPDDNVLATSYWRPLPVN